MPSFVHCVGCGKVPEAEDKLYVSTCGHTFCDGCNTLVCKQNICSTCQKQCRTQQIASKMTGSEFFQGFGGSFDQAMKKLQKYVELEAISNVPNKRFQHNSNITRLLSKRLNRASEERRKVLKKLSAGLKKKFKNRAKRKLRHSVTVSSHNTSTPRIVFSNKTPQKPSRLMPLDFPISSGRKLATKTPMRTPKNHVMTTFRARKLSEK